MTREVTTPELEPGTFLITSGMDDRARASCKALPRADGNAHPIFAFIAALGGMGTSIAALCELCGSSIEAGPVLASTRIRWLAPMPVDSEYGVEARIVDTVAKQSRRFGKAIHARIRFTVLHGETECAEVDIHMILPERESDDE